MDHRRQSRYELETLVKITRGSENLLGTTLDISLSGLSIEINFELFNQQPLLVSFRLSLRDKPITTWCKPVWSIHSNGKYRVGLEFTNLDSAHHREIADFIAEVWQSSHGSLK